MEGSRWHLESESHGTVPRTATASSVLHAQGGGCPRALGAPKSRMEMEMGTAFITSGRFGSLACESFTHANHICVGWCQQHA